MTQYRKLRLLNKYRYSANNLVLQKVFCKIKEKTVIAFLLLLFTRPLPRDGGMAEDHGVPDAGKLPRVWARGRRETDNRQRVNGAKSP